MMRQGSPYGQYQKYFNQGATYPYARYKSDEEENELHRARELYKNLQGSPGGWQTRALRGQSQQLKRRLGENEQQYRQRAAEYERRIREGEDAGSLLGSQLDESRLAFGKLQQRYGESQEDFNRRTQEYERRLREGEDARSLLGSQLDESRIEYGGLHQRYGDLESQVNQRNKEREDKRRAFQETYDKDYIEKQLLPVIQKHYPSMIQSYKDLESMKQYPGSGYKPGMTGEAYKNTWNNPNYQHVYKQFPAYQPPQYPTKEDLRRGILDRDKRNSETESMYQAKMADFQRMLEEERSEHASDLQSQMEGMSEQYDSEFERFLKDQDIVSQGGSIPDDRSYFAPSDFGKSQASFASSIASKQSLNRVKDLFDQSRKRETDLKQLTGRYDEERKKHNQWVKESEEKQNKLGGDVKRLTGDALLKDAELKRLRARDQEYTNYRRETSPLRREHPVLKQQLHKISAQIPPMQKTYEEGRKYVNQFKDNYNQLLKRKKAVDTFIHYYPDAGRGLHKELGYRESAQTMNPWSWASR